MKQTKIFRKHYIESIKGFKISLEALYQNKRFKEFDEILGYIPFDNWNTGFVNYTEKYDGLTLIQLSFDNDYYNILNYCYKQRHNNFKKNIFFYCDKGDFEGVYYKIRKGYNINSKNKNG